MSLGAPPECATYLQSRFLKTNVRVLVTRKEHNPEEIKVTSVCVFFSFSIVVVSNYPQEARVRKWELLRHLHGVVFQSDPRYRGSVNRCTLNNSLHYTDLEAVMFSAAYLQHPIFLTVTSF
jgi:hypothetical protein